MFIKNQLIKYVREYLVNFEYLVRIMDDYGFTLVTNDEAKQMGLPSNSGLFSELYAELENDVKNESKLKKDFKQKAIYMTSVEKNISFMNRYCIFKKTTTVPAAKIAKLLLNAKKMSSMFDTDYDEESELAQALEKEQELQSPIKGDIKKIKAKIVLKPMNDNLEILSSDSESSDDEFEPISKKSKKEESDSEDERKKKKKMKKKKRRKKRRKRRKRRKG